MELIDVNVIRAQIVQGNAKLLPEFVRVGSRRLRRNIDFFPHALKRFSKLLLAVRVEPRGIKKSDAGIICLSRQLHGVLRADPLDRKCAKPVLIDGNPCFSKCHSLHFFASTFFLYTLPAKKLYLCCFLNTTSDKERILHSFPFCQTCCCTAKYYSSGSSPLPHPSLPRCAKIRRRTWNNSLWN